MNLKKIFDARRHYYGGNSGYVGYSKSKRAVNAENRGLRTLTHIDKEFAEEVSEAVGRKVSVKEIKDAIKSGLISADEWHHTSMYGNKTNYYSVETVSSYFAEEEESEADRDNEDVVSVFNILLSEYEHHNDIYTSYTNWYDEFNDDGTPRDDFQVKMEYTGSFNDSDNPSDWDIIEYRDKQKVGEVEFDALNNEVQELLLGRREVSKRYDTFSKVFEEYAHKQTYNIFDAHKVTPEEVKAYAYMQGYEF